MYRILGDFLGYIVSKAKGGNYERKQNNCQ